MVWGILCTFFFCFLLLFVAFCCFSSAFSCGFAENIYCFVDLYLQRDLQHASV
jgi:hypothetical protein